MSLPASGLAYQVSDMEQTAGQPVTSRPSGAGRMAVERRSGVRPRGASPASSAVASAQAPAALTITGASKSSCGVLRDRKSTTSELQSLMRISYAVFCLKKKKKKQYSAQ